MIIDLVTDKELLSKRTKEFKVIETSEGDIKSLIDDLGDTLRAHNELFWLTSNQIGRTERAFALKFNDEIDVFLNPAFLLRKTMIIYREKDVLTNDEYFIPRYSDISLGFQNSDGISKGVKFSSAASISICQAMDMLDGVTAADYGLEIIPGFDEASEEDKQEVLSMYIQSLKDKAAEFDNELTTDAETKDVWNAYKFVSSVATGKTLLESPEISNRKKKKIRKFLKSLGIKEKKK